MSRARPGAGIVSTPYEAHIGYQTVGVFKGPKIKTQAGIISEYNDGSAEYLHLAVERRFGQQKFEFCSLLQGSGLQ